MRGQAFTVVEHPSDIPIHKITDHSGQVEEAVDLFLRDLIASDRSRATIKTYAFVLCSWLNFLESRAKPWQSASLEELRDYILFLRAADNPTAQGIVATAQYQVVSMCEPGSPISLRAISLLLSTTG